MIHLHYHSHKIELKNDAISKTANAMKNHLILIAVENIRWVLDMLMTLGHFANGIFNAISNTISRNGEHPASVLTLGMADMLVTLRC